MTREIFLSIWGSAAAFARAIDVSDTTVRHWFQRGSIPPRYDADIIKAARLAGRPITHEELFHLRQNLARDAERAA